MNLSFKKDEILEKVLANIMGISQSDCLSLNFKRGLINVELLELLRKINELDSNY